MNGDPLPADRVERALRDVLARPEFEPQPDQESAFLSWLRELFSSGSSAGVAGDVASALAILSALALAVWLTTLVLGRARTASAARAADGPSTVAPTPFERARGLVEAARRARSDGDLRLALRLYFCALVVGLGARGDLEYDDAFTNRELLERGRPDADLRALLEPLVRELDVKGFGRLEPDERDVARLAGLVDEHLGGPA